jgi:site-specific recombinase XerD
MDTYDAGEIKSGEVPEISAFEAELVRLEETALAKSLADNTRRGYKNDWKDFGAWCSEQGALDLPASVDTLKRYFLVRSKTHAKATLNRRIMAISRRHKEQQHPDPTRDETFKRIMSGIRKQKLEPQNAKHALMADDLKTILEEIDETTVKGKRDRALLLIGFLGALRRSEVVALNREDLSITRDGIILKIRRSKRDQEGVGHEVAIPRGRNPQTCPVIAMEDWLKVHRVEGGALFCRVSKGAKIMGRLCDRSVALLVKRYVGHAGLSSEYFSGHSLRAGLATSAALEGRDERQIMEQTRHKSVKTVRTYIRKGTLFRDNVAGSLGF